MNPLPNDFTRCYGNSCQQKHDCRRFLTIRVDPKAALPYMATAVNDTGDCDSFIPASKTCRHCED